MNAATWVLVGVIAIVAIYMTGWVKGRTHGIAEGHAIAASQWRALAGRLARESQQWQALVDEQDDELRDKDAKLTKADAANMRLVTERNVAYDAGFIGAINARQVEP